MIGSFHAVVIDTPDPDRAASSYAELLGRQRVEDDDDFVVIGDTADRPGLAFTRVFADPDLQPFCLVEF